jgi:hypothetical protein
MGHKGMVGYVGLCLLSATAYGVVCIMVPVLHGYEATSSSRTPIRAFARLIRNTLPACSASLIPLAIALYEYPAYLIQELST